MSSNCNIQSLSSLKLHCGQCKQHQRLLEKLLGPYLTNNLLVQVVSHLKVYACCLINHIYHKIRKQLKQFLRMHLPKMETRKLQMVDIKNELLKQILLIENEGKVLLCCPQTRQTNSTKIISQLKKVRSQNIRYLQQLQQEKYKIVFEQVIRLLVSDEQGSKKLFFFVDWKIADGETLYDIRRKVNIIFNENGGHFYICVKESQSEKVQVLLKKIATQQISVFHENINIWDLFRVQRQLRNQRFFFVILEGGLQKVNNLFFVKTVTYNFQEGLSEQVAKKDVFSHFQYNQSNIFEVKGKKIHKFMSLMSVRALNILEHNKKKSIKEVVTNDIRPLGPYIGRYNSQFIEQDIDRLRRSFRVYTILALKQQQVQANKKYIFQLLSLRQSQGIIFNVESFIPKFSFSSPTLGILILNKQTEVQQGNIGKYSIKKMSDNDNPLQIVANLTEGQNQHLQSILTKWKYESIMPFEYKYEYGEITNNKMKIRVQFDSGLPYILSLGILTSIMGKKIKNISDITQYLPIY